MKNGLIFSFGALAAALSMIFLDQDVATYFGHGAETHLWQIAREVTDVALAEYWFVLGFAILIIGLFPFRSQTAGNMELVRENVRRFAAYLLASLFGSGIALEILKFMIGRERPAYSPNFDPMIFHPFSVDSHFQSLPSGHTQVLFTVATTFTMLWPRAGWFLYPLAAVVAFTRVVTFQHYISDVIAGAMLGYFCTLWVHSMVAKKLARPDFGFTKTKNR